MPAVTLKALLEVLNCAICTGAVVGFVINMVLETGVPTVTSPKSSVVGLISRAAFELVDANGLEFEPHPERARPSASVATHEGMHAIALRYLLFVLSSGGRFAARISLVPENKILRNLHIDIT